MAAMQPPGSAGEVTSSYPELLAQQRLGMRCVLAACGRGLGYGPTVLGMAAPEPPGVVQLTAASCQRPK
jgi:hypothetical protein